MMSKHSSTMERPVVRERRRHVRYAGNGLVLVIGGQPAAVADISLGGARVAPGGVLRQPPDLGQVVAVRLLRCDDLGAPLPEAPVAVAGRVVGADTGGLRLCFQGAGADLAWLIAHHARRHSDAALFSVSVF